MTGAFASTSEAIIDSTKVKRSPADEFSSESLQTPSERVKSDGEGKRKVVPVWSESPSVVL